MNILILNFLASKIVGTRTQEKPEPRILPHVEVCLGAGKRKMSVFE